MATENLARTGRHGPDHGHHHRDVSGGWLRPAVFGAMDGLVTNVSLIAGVGGGGGTTHTIVLTGLAGLVAGACSMATGEYVSVSSQNELIHAEVNKERIELENNAVAEQAELAAMLRARGVSAATARQAAAEISAHPDKALAVHALEELGVDPGELPSPVVAAGAFSMATGEFVSVSSQNELVQAEVRKEAHELKHNPDSEREELAATFRVRGVDPELADEVARQISAHPDDALAVHVREELGVDPEELPSPYTAAGASLVTFAVGALIPLIPYLAGLNSLALALGLAALAAFIGGGLVARLTDRPFLRGALRQLLLGALAAGLTYLIGHAVGSHV